MGTETASAPEPSGLGLVAVLSTTAGAADAICFLALGGLFVAHVTGDIVIAIAHYVAGGGARPGPLLAVPVFVSALCASVLIAGVADRVGASPRRVLLLLQAALLAACLALAVEFGSFAHSDEPMAVLVGMIAVAAMAVQSAAVRLTLPNTPATAVLTMNVVHLSLDLTTRALTRGAHGDRSRDRLTVVCVAGFVSGCVAGTALETRFGLDALALPVALSALAVPLAARA